ncbi:MAG: hypothetical protein HQL42_12975 [Alphaproteobacteria bacterium]|nr:hypothetical protein [Alphaproteobacteria bacterium]
MEMILHIRPSSAARLIRAFDMPAAEKALGVPFFEVDAAPGEEVIAVKSRRMVRKLLAARGIPDYIEINCCRKVV